MNNHYPEQQQQQQAGSGLTRYRSAPSSFYDTLLDSSSNNDNDVGFGAEDFDHVQLFNPPASHFQSQSQQLSSQFVQLQPHDQQSLQKSSDYSSTMYNTNNNDGTNSDVENALFGGSMNSNRTSQQIKMEEGGGLIRHSSSPAGFFANLDIEKEFGTMRGGMENVGTGNSSNAEASFSPAIRFKRNIDFSLQNSSPLGKRRTMENNPGQRFVEDRSNGGGDNVPGFSTTNSWNSSAMLSDDFFEGLLDNNDEETFTNANVSDTTNNGGKRHTTLLSHRSLPVNSSEFYAMENLLEDSVPCKTRAKRGFATHPRSIAERVRITKISDRIKRLEDLVPNMEKQTNTADMLDLAVDYIKNLQRQVKILSDNGAKCSCLAKEKS